MIDRLTRKRLSGWLALGCFLALVAMLTIAGVRGLRFGFGPPRGLAAQFSDRSVAVPVADEFDRSSRLVSPSVATDPGEMVHGAVGTAGLQTSRQTHTGMVHSAEDQAVSVVKSTTGTDSDTALFASVERLERRVAAAIGSARESVVALEYTAVDAPAGTRRRATGVVINNRGEVLSVRIDPPAVVPAPVAGGQRTLIVARDFEGRRYSAHWVATDPDTGLTLLRLPPRSVRPIRATTDAPNLGSQVFVVGNAFGMGHSVSRGHVAALERALELGACQLGGLIQIQAPIYPGDSGGAVVNLQGDWLGLIRSGLARPSPESASESGPGVPSQRAGTTTSASPSFARFDVALFRPERDTEFGFAIPARDALWVAEQLRAQGRVDRAYLGVRLESVPAGIGQVGLSAAEHSSPPASTTTPSVPLADPATEHAHEPDHEIGSADEGAILRDVLDGTPASQAGLRPGDGIVALDDHRIRTAHDLTDRLDRIPARTTIRLGVVRGRGPLRQRICLSLLTASRPEPARVTAPDSPPATLASSAPAAAFQAPAAASQAPAAASQAPAGLAPATGNTTAGQPPRPELQVQGAAALSAPQTDELRLPLPRAVVDRLEQLERRLEKLESFPGRPTSPTPAVDRQISAARSP